jgi:hypothetical protein
MTWHRAKMDRAAEEWMQWSGSSTPSALRAYARWTVATIGDAHLPRDVTSAVSHAARLDGLADSPSFTLRGAIAGAKTDESEHEKRPTPQ